MAINENELVPGRFGDVDAIGNTEPYVTYLDRAHAALKSLRQFANSLLNLSSAKSILDVGCGTGDTLRELAEMIEPGGTAIGIDYSRAMIEEARERTKGSSNIRFEHGDVYRLPFADEEFDACSSERLLVHLQNPLKAIREMGRVVKADGRLVVTEGDLEMVTLDSSDHITARAIWDFLLAGLENGRVGRQLLDLFHAAGFQRVIIHAKPLVIRSFEFFNQIFPFETAALAAGEQGEINKDKIVRLLADLHERDRRGIFFGCVVGFIAEGRKP